MRRLAALFAAIAVLAVAAAPVAATPTALVGYPGVWQAVDVDGSKVVIVIGRTATPVVAVNDDYAADCASLTNSVHWTAVGYGEYQQDGTLWVNLLRGRCGSYQVRLDDWGYALSWDEGSDTLWLDDIHFWRVAG